jgi:hypothetical protein
MTFAKKPERLPARPTSGAASLPFGLRVRTLLIGLLAIAGATWALARHYTHAPEPMRVPVPATAPTYDTDAGEMPVPDLTGPEEDAR